MAVTSANVSSRKRTEDPGAAQRRVAPAATITGRKSGVMPKLEKGFQCLMAVPRCALVTASNRSAAKIPV